MDDLLRDIHAHTEAPTYRVWKQSYMNETGRYVYNVYIVEPSGQALQLNGFIEHANDDDVPDGAVPAYLLDREGVSRAKVLSNTVKQKRKEKAGKWSVPIPKVKAVADDEMFRVMRTGKRKAKTWKRINIT